MIPLLSKGTLLMTPLSRLLSRFIPFASTLLALVVDGVWFLRLCLRPPTTLAAENLFLRKQLALYQERHVKPTRATNATRLALVWLSRWFSLASGVGYCAARHFYPLASTRIPALLALEIPLGSSPHSCGPASAYPPHGPGKPDVGPGAHRS